MANIAYKPPSPSLPEPNEVRGRLLAEYYSMILRAATYWTRNQQAEDVAQRACLKLFESPEPWETFEKVGLEGFISGVVKFVAWGDNRRGARRGEELLEKNLPPSQEPTPFDHASTNEVFDMIKSFLSSNPGEYDLWFACSVERKTPQELEAEFGIGKRQIQRRVKKIRKKLQGLRNVLFPA